MAQASEASADRQSSTLRLRPAGSERSESNGLSHVRICASRFLFRLYPSLRRWQSLCRAHVQRRRAGQGPQRWTRCALDCLSKTCDISASGVPAIRGECHCTRTTDQAMDTCKKTRAHRRRQDTIENSFETANAITLLDFGPIDKWA